MSVLSLFIAATDHVGRSTMSQSPGVTVDSTPPDVSAVPMDVGGSYVTERRELSVAWRGIFSDDESGQNIIRYCFIFDNRLYINTHQRNKRDILKSNITMRCCAPEI